MAIRNATVTITTIGAAAGPFTVTDGLGQTYTNVPRSELLSGYTNPFDDNATNITVTSTGACTSQLVIPVILPSPTPTPTPSPAPYIAVTVLMANTTNTVCSAFPEVRYTDDGTIAPFKELRRADGSLETAFLFVADGGGGPIYNLSSGFIGSDSGAPAC